jgi:hypothetical protein
MEYFIYGLRAIKTGEIIYVGSTKDARRREIEHKYNTDNETKESSYLIYTVIRELGGWSEVEMELLGIFNDDNRLQTERDFIDYLKPCGNNIRPKVSPEERKQQIKEWYEQHPDYKKTFYQANREKLIQKTRENQLANPERTKQQQKKWRQENREKTAKYMREWRRKKKEAEAEAEAEAET